MRSGNESFRLLVNLVRGKSPFRAPIQDGETYRLKRGRLRYSFLLCVVLWGCGRTPNGGAPTKAAPVQSFSPREGDDRFDRGAVALDSVVVSPNQSTLTISGTLPTPCHELRLSEASAPDAEGFIRLEAWSVADPSQMCAQVLQPFSVQVLVKAGLRIKVNGQLGKK